MLTKFFLSSGLVLAMAASAAAADLPSEKGPPVYVPPPPPVFSWTGVYIGAQAGYGWGHKSDYTLFPGGAVAQGVGSNPSGFVGGGHVGYNYQISQFVIGLEGDVNGSTGHSNEANFGFVGNGREEFDASIRGRAGVAFDRILIFATGGVVFGDFNSSVTDPFGVVESHNRGDIGWTVGGGLEYAIDNNWSVRGEYRYIDYRSGGINYTTLALSPFTVHQHLTDNRVQAGFSYKFDMFAPPAPVVSKY
jgi:outer membrane immunogenic protein